MYTTLDLAYFIAVRNIVTRQLHYIEGQIQLINGQLRSRNIDASKRATLVQHVAILRDQCIRHRKTISDAIAMVTGISNGTAIVTQTCFPWNTGNTAAAASAVSGNTASAVSGNSAADAAGDADDDDDDDNINNNIAATTTTTTSAAASAVSGNSAADAAGDADDDDDDDDDDNNIGNDIAATTTTTTPALTSVTPALSRQWRHAESRPRDVANITDDLDADDPATIREDNEDIVKRQKLQENINAPQITLTQGTNTTVVCLPTSLSEDEDMLVTNLHDLIKDSQEIWYKQDRIPTKVSFPERRKPVIHQEHRLLLDDMSICLEVNGYVIPSNMSIKAERQDKGMLFLTCKKSASGEDLFRANVEYFVQDYDKTMYLNELVMNQDYNAPKDLVSTLTVIRLYAHALAGTSCVMDCGKLADDYRKHLTWGSETADLANDILNKIPLKGITNQVTPPSIPANAVSSSPDTNRLVQMKDTPAADTAEHSRVASAAVTAQNSGTKRKRVIIQDSEAEFE